jgi:hypothetical protein
MTSDAAGPRYLAVTPPAGLASVALRVDLAGAGCTGPDQYKYVDAAGLLVDTPVNQSSTDWGTIHVTGRQIIPSTLYGIEAEVGGSSIGSDSATTYPWGNVNNADDVNIFDILCVFDGFGGSFVNCSAYAVDLMGLVPDLTIDIDDVTAVLDAFEGLPYPDGTPCAPVPPPPSAMSGEPADEDGGEFILIPSSRTVAPGQTVRVDVYSSDINNLRAYQLALDVIGGELGSLQPEGVTIDTERSDYIFAGANGFVARDQKSHRIASLLTAGGATPPGRVYMGSFNFRASADAAGDFTITLRTADVRLRDSLGQPAAGTMRSGVEIHVSGRAGPEGRRAIEDPPPVPIDSRGARGQEVSHE